MLNKNESAVNTVLESQFSAEDAAIIREAQMEISQPTGAYTRFSIQTAPELNFEERASILSEYFPVAIELTKGTYITGAGGEYGAMGITDYINFHPDNSFEDDYWRKLDLENECLREAKTDEDLSAIAVKYNLQKDTVRLIADNPTFTMVPGYNNHGFDESTYVYDMVSIARDYPGFLLDISTEYKPVLHVEIATVLHDSPYMENRVPVSAQSLNEADKKAIANLTSSGPVIGHRANEGGVFVDVQNMDGSLLRHFQD